MSFRRPKARYRRHPTANPSSSTPSFTSTPLPDTSVQAGIIPLADAPRQKRPRHSTSLFLPGPEELIALPGKVRFTQTSLAAQVGGRELQSAESTRTSSTKTTDAGACDSTDPIFHTTFNEVQESDLDDQRAYARRKRARQHSNWTTNVIPSLSPIFLRLLRETESLRLKPNSPPSPSTCRCTSKRPVVITCLYFQRE
jgi:hypothetical protein